MLEIKSMSVTFPSSSIFVIGQALRFFTTIFTDKNPDFSLLDLHSKKGRFFYFTKCADFSFHFEIA